MIDHQALLADLQRLLATLEADLRARIQDQPALDERLRADYQAARQGARTAAPYEEWREEVFTQSAVAWILACVFVRFMEDNGLLETPRLAGPGARLALARDHQTVFFQKHPTDTEREYLHAVFRDAAALPAVRELFDERHNPLWSLAPSGDGARALLLFWQRVDPATGGLHHDFTDAEWDTRFLGDLYQDLSEQVRKRYALLQTPEFVEEFILDRTLVPALDAFGWRELRLIDPACGSGHFLLGAFRRLFELRQREEPAVEPRESAQRALEAVCGVDVNPYAVAIARFRLLVAALRASGLTRLRDAPAFHLHVATGDSLLHGKRWQLGTSREARPGVQRDLLGGDRVEHFYASEDREALARLLGRQYHVVVGNPPYITVKDRALNDAYRQRYESCHMKYSLAVPFMERFFELALAPGDPMAAGSARAAAGFVGMITANSFMKREFGKKLIEQFIPRWDLTHVVDTSGAYIPGHGTPTVILFGRHQRPAGETVRAVMGIRGEPTTPDDPARGLVWTAITAQIDQPGSTSEWVSTSDTARETFARHPWSIGGGGAAELKELIEEQADKPLGQIATAVGITAVTGEDDLYLLDDVATARRLRVEHVRSLVVGDVIRDWTVAQTMPAIWLYDDTLALQALPDLPCTARLLWNFRAAISRRKRFGTPMLQRGLTWYEWQELYVDKLRTPLSIAFAEVSTHNHFVLDRGGKVFKQTAPVIKLPEAATEDEHLKLVGLLNSSTGCFWMRQTAHNKGARGTGGGFVSELWEQFFQFGATKIEAFPIPAGAALDLARELDRRATTLAALMPAALVAQATPTAASLRNSRDQAEACRRRMIALQEELDWRCCRLYGLLDDELTLPVEHVPEIALGERAFEIALARRMAAGEVQTAWFERHGSTPITAIPARWPDDYRRLVERRLAAIEANPNVRLIEQPEYKRRWNSEPWDDAQQRALRSWLLDRLETPAYWPAPELRSCARLADRAHADSEFMQVAALYRGRADFDVTALVSELVESEAVPVLPVLRYKDSGLRKREQWQRTWELQRREDRGEALGEIPVPPKYTAADFQKGHYWRLRGKLDVPKERFLSLPGCERDADRTPLVGWAGWDHLQQAQALATYYVAMKDQEGWPPERLAPLLAGVQELLPWLEQWHNALDPTYGQGLGDYYRGFVEVEARELGFTLEALRNWKANSRRRRRGTLSR